MGSTVFLDDERDESAPETGRQTDRGFLGGGHDSVEAAPRGLYTYRRPSSPFRSNVPTDVIISRFS